MGLAKDLSIDNDKLIVLIHVYNPVETVAPISFYGGALRLSLTLPAFLLTLDILIDYLKDLLLELCLHSVESLSLFGKFEHLLNYGLIAAFVQVHILLEPANVPLDLNVVFNLIEVWEEHPDKRW